MPSFSYAQITKGLKKSGFVFKRQGKGPHEFWKNEQTEKIVMIAKHTKNIPNGTMTFIVKSIGFKGLKDFEDFLKS